MAWPKNRRILYMEDDLGLARLVQKRLERLGYCVELARDGEEGLVLAEQGEYDLIAIDHSMPKYRGLEVLRILQARREAPPIIMITGSGDENLAVDAMKSGASDYLVKDLEGGFLDMLPSVIEQALHQNNLDQEKAQMEARLRQMHQKIEQLHGVALQMAACEGEACLYQFAIETVHELLPLSQAFLLERTPPCWRLLCAWPPFSQKEEPLPSSHGFSGETTPEERTVLRERPPLPGEEIVLEPDELLLEAVQKGTPQLYEEVGALFEQWSLPPHGSSAIVVPLEGGGLFVVVPSLGYRLGPDDLQLMKLLAGHTNESLRRLRVQRHLAEKASLDPLTGLYNRRHFAESIENELERSRRYNHSIAFAMIDINRFKEINDTQGHQAGDRVLQEVARILKENIRKIDFVVRYGGDEFLVVFPETHDACDSFLERVEEALDELNSNSSPVDFPLTLSIGSSLWEPHTAVTLEQAIAEADERMYQHKRLQKEGALLEDPSWSPCGERGRRGAQSG